MTPTPRQLGTLGSERLEMVRRGGSPQVSGQIPSPSSIQIEVALETLDKLSVDPLAERESTGSVGTLSQLDGAAGGDEGAEGGVEKEPGKDELGKEVDEGSQGSGGSFV